MHQPGPKRIKKKKMRKKKEEEGFRKRGPTPMGKNKQRLLMQRTSTTGGTQNKIAKVSLGPGKQNAYQRVRKETAVTTGEQKMNGLHKTKETRREEASGRLGNAKKPKRGIKWGHKIRCDG